MKKFLVVMAAAMVVGMTKADETQIVTVNGHVLDKNVTTVSFNGDNVYVTFDDATSETVDMSNINIAFDYSNAIRLLEGEDGKTVIFDLKGVIHEKEPENGVYIMKRGKKVVKVIR